MINIYIAVLDSNMEDSLKYILVNIICPIFREEGQKCAPSR